MLMAISIMGCDNAKDYSGEYNFETDDQYSYATSIVSWKKYQSDGNGQYILMNDYIYYYNNKRIKEKLKGLTPASYRSQSLLVS